jgi:hypothetical protein
VHSEDLHKWDRFPRCQEFDAVTYGQYRSEAYQVERRRRTVAHLLSARASLDELDTDEPVEYRDEMLEVPRRSPSRRTVRLALPEAPRRDAWVESSSGRVQDGTVEVEAHWRRRWIHLRYRGPSRSVHAERIDELRRLLDAMSEEQRRTIEEVTSSRFAHPVLFISHRWESEAHPDPSGSQLRKLRALKDCFLVYDYSSFPQPPRSNQEEADFKEILASMDQLITKVVVLEARDYLTRGWCVYEYIVASLHRTTVCDELQDRRFVKLRDWAGTPPPLGLTFRDSNESQQQNFINERILDAVQEVLPIYSEGQFQNEHDRDLVTELLIDHLKRALPPIKESNPYFGEWKTTQWTNELLAPFFVGGSERPRLESAIPIRRFDTSVPSTLQDAVNCRYEIKRFKLLDALNPMDTLLRTDWTHLANAFRRRGRRG